MTARPPLRAGALFLVVLAASALFLRPSAYLSDDVAQSAGLHAMRDGSFSVRWNDLGPSYWAIQDGYFWQFGLPDGPGDTASPLGSLLLDAAALPVLVLLEFPAQLLGLAATAGLVAAFVVALGVHVAWTRLASPTHQRHARAAAAATFLVLAVPAFFLPRTDAEALLELLSLQVVLLLGAATAAVFLRSIVRERLGERAGLAAAWVYALGTPALWWSQEAKYIGLAMDLVVLAVWALRDGARATRGRAAVAGLAIGLSWWNQAPMGGILAVAVALVMLPALRNAVGAVRLALAGAAGLAVGLGGDLLCRIQLAREGVGSQFFDLSTYVASIGGAVGRLHAALPLMSIDPALGGYSVWADPLGVLRAIPEALIWPPEPQKYVSIGMLAFVPIAALGLRAMVGLSTKAPRVWTTWAWAYSATLFCLVGQALFRRGGGGYDVRYAATLWPVLILVSAPALAAAVQRLGTAVAARLVALSTTLCIGVALSVLSIAHAMAGTFSLNGADQDLTRLFEVGGLALAAAILVLGGRRWMDRVILLACGLPLALQAILLLGPARTSWPASYGPMALWPMELLHHAVTAAGWNGTFGHAW